MDDVSFFKEIVVPAVEEFNREPGDIRRGVTACILLQSMVEHYFWQRMADASKSREQNEPALRKFKGDLRKDSWLIGEIAGIANGTKHARSDFFDLTHQCPAVCGVLRAGFPLAHVPYVFTDPTHAWLLYQLTNALEKWWRAKLGVV